MGSRGKNKEGLYSCTLAPKELTEDQGEFLFRRALDRASRKGSNTTEAALDQQMWGLNEDFCYTAWTVAAGRLWRESGQPDTARAPTQSSPCKWKLPAAKQAGLIFLDLGSGSLGCAFLRQDSMTSL